MLLAFGDTSCDWIAVIHRDIGGSRHIVVVAVAVALCIVNGRHGVRVVLGQVAPALNVDDGQFDDAPEDVGYARIDDTELINLTSDEDEDEYDDYSEEYDQVRVEDEDWEVAEKATSTATTTPSKSAGRKGSNVAILPAVNHPSQSTAARKAASTVAKDQTASRLASTLGVVVNRKGASAYANLKDKTDRTTTEQVLDARTRVVLLKMVGWGIIGFHRGDQWLWINVDHNEYDIDIKYYDYKDKDHKGKQYTWEPVFENWNDWKGWKKGKYTPFQYRVYHEGILRDR
ncbi:hypothetical protein ARMSODRAFT_1002464 [Armillaria solidipes]|uniref:Uncharacterized protein n=1 Tax=Armillaria solidipes TaxID=1076256 RepID=A0A2H3BNA6_9AGAR|nr:hypothetical protein ARMSODRAFT_1002464 [Armillaria solidipes]